MQLGTALGVQEGGTVSAGGVVGRLDDAEAQAQLLVAESNLRAAQVQLPVFSANKGPVHVREKGRQTPRGALAPEGEGDRSGR